MRQFISLALITTLVFMTVPVFADNSARKLGRGAVNLLTFWAEVPARIVEVTQEKGQAAGLIYGPVKGFFCGVTRFFAGAYEIITFPFPVPRDYEPLIEPEFVMMPKEEGEYKSF